MGSAVTIAEIAKGAGLLLAASYVVLLAGEKLPDRLGAKMLANGVIFGIAASP